MLIKINYQMVDDFTEKFYFINNQNVSLVAEVNTIKSLLVLIVAQMGRL